MVGKRTILGVVIGTVALYSILSGESTNASCSFVNPLGLRFDSAAYAVVMPTPDTVEAGYRGAYDVHLDVWDSIRERLFGSSVHGQLAELVRYGGPWDKRLVDTGREVILVPWDLSGSGSCDPTPWDHSYRWLSPDSSYLVIGSVREPKYWTRNRPVIDIPPSRFVYPGPWYDPQSLDHIFVQLPGEDTAKAESRLAGADRSHLNPVTLFSIYQAMPTYRDAESDPDGAEARIEHWEATNSELLNNFIVLKMIRFAKARVQAIREYCTEAERCG